MEKISGIIPRNARNSSADVSKSQPVRPGAPSFGRPMGKVTARTFSDAAPVKEAEVAKETFFVDNKKISLPVVEENPIEDKITISSDLKELKKLQAETNEIENEVVARTLASDAKPLVQAEADAKPNSAQYNKKGEALKAAIAVEVSKKFNNLEV